METRAVVFDLFPFSLIRMSFDDGAEGSIFPVAEQPARLVILRPAYNYFS